jgi:hypothetical protein
MFLLKARGKHRGIKPGVERRGDAGVMGNRPYPHYLISAPPSCHLPVILGHVLSPNPVPKKTGSISRLVPGCLRPFCEESDDTFVRCDGTVRPNQNVSNYPQLILHREPGMESAPRSTRLPGAGTRLLVP